MPRVTEAALLELKLKYQAAHSTYDSRVAALSETERRGAVPSNDRLEELATALAALERARREYRDALFELAFPCTPASYRKRGCKR
jgi:hypothetical protein